MVERGATPEFARKLTALGRLCRMPLLETDFSLIRAAIAPENAAIGICVALAMHPRHRHFVAAAFRRHGSEWNLESAVQTPSERNIPRVAPAVFLAHGGVSVAGWVHPTSTAAVRLTSSDFVSHDLPVTEGIVVGHWRVPHVGGADSFRLSLMDSSGSVIVEKSIRNGAIELTETVRTLPGGREPK